MTPRQGEWAVLLGAFALGLALVRAGLAAPSPVRRTEELRANETLAVVAAVGALAWPLVFQTFVGLDAAARAPALLAALVWPVALLLLDLSTVDRQTLDTEARRCQRGMQLETNSIASLTFAVGGLLLTHLGRRWAETAVPLLCAVVFFCVAFVTPRPALQPRTVESVRVHAMQRVALVHCIGLLSAAVLLVMQVVHRRVPASLVPRE